MFGWVGLPSATLFGLVALARPSRLPGGLPTIRSALSRNGIARQLERFVAEVEGASQSADVDDEMRQHERRELVIITQDDGTVLVRARLSAEAGTALRRAVETQVQRETSRDRTQAKAAGLET